MRSLILASMILLVLMGSAVTFAQTYAVSLSSLDLTEVTCGWGKPKADLGVVGQPMSMRGHKYQHGLGVHANSKMRVRLGGEALAFKSVVGIDDSAEGSGSLRFIVRGDGKVLWDSGVIGGSADPLSVDVALQGVNILELEVNDGGDGSGYDHADWAEATIEMASESAKPVVLPVYQHISVKGRSLALEFLVGDDGRLYQRSLGGVSIDGKQARPDEAYPQGGDGYVFEPALQVIHADGNRSTSLAYISHSQEQVSPDIQETSILLRDTVYPLDVTLHFRLHTSLDLIEQWVSIQNNESGPITLERMASSSLIFNPNNLSLTHFYGDWYDEMNPYTERLTPGTKVIDSKLGVRAHQFRNPSFYLSLDDQVSETQGRVMGGTLAWSGNFRIAFDHDGKRVHALCGVNPYESAYELKPGETFVTPTMLWVWSDRGLGEMSRKLHSWARDFGIRDGHTPRATLLNNWEATGFDFDFNRIVDLYDPAVEAGVELFLLDDGWFGNKYPRVNDQAGLGDWKPNRLRLPNGLEPLAKEAIKRGLRFGIWLEPEMVNPKSELYEQHPDWVIHQPGRPLDLQRHQLILDITRPEVQDFEWKTIQSILGVPGVSYAKWDANRYITQPGSPYLPPDRQTHLWIDYTHKLYELMAKTAETYPDVELMLCSGGGGRVDYGALKYFHEFWPSDNTDALRRVSMQWDYSYFFPPISICSHVTHTGNRPMHFATAVAMSARFGMDLDLANLSEEQLAVCKGAIEGYKQIRDIVHLGDLYRVEDPRDGTRGVINYVSQDRTRAVVFVFQLQNPVVGPVMPRGLDPDRRYVIHEVNPAPGRAPIEQQGKTLFGRQIMTQGLLPSCKASLEACVIALTPEP